MNKSAEFFEKFLELGSVAKVAKYYGVSRQNVHQYLTKLPEYQQYKRNPPTPPSCPKCESDRTVANGKSQYGRGRHKYKCRVCNYQWDEAPGLEKVIT